VLELVEELGEHGHGTGRNGVTRRHGGREKGVTKEVLPQLLSLVSQYALLKAEELKQRELEKNRLSSVPEAIGDVSLEEREKKSRINPNEGKVHATDGGNSVTCSHRVRPTDVQPEIAEEIVR